MVNSQLHMIDVEVGWQWFVWRGLSLRAAVGFTGTVGAHSEISRADGQPLSFLEASFAEDGARRLDETYTRYVFAPVLSLGAGWRFF